MNFLKSSFVGFLLIALVFTATVHAQSVDFPRGTVSVTYCYGMDNLNYVNLDANYYVYYLTFAGYPLSYMNVFGGISYTFDQTLQQTSTLGYRLGAQLVVLFVGVKPTFESGSLVYKNFDSCYFYMGGNYPVLWESGYSGTK